MSDRLRLVCATILLALLGVGAVAGVVRLEVDSDLESLLPADDPAVAELDAMARAFGGDPVVVLVEGGGNPLGEERLPALLRLEGELSAVDGVVATYGPATTLNQTVLRVKQLIAELSGQRDALEQAGLTRQLRLFDQRYGALLVQAMPAGLPTLHNQGFVRSVVLDAETRRTKPQWRQYLPARETVAIYLRPREGLDERAAAALTAEVRRVVDGADAVPADADVTVTGAPVVSVGLAERLGDEVPRLAVTAFVVVAAVLFLVPWTRRRRWRLAPLLVMAGATAGTLATFGWREEPLSIGAATFLPIILGLGSYYPVYLSRPGHRRVVLAVAVSSMLAFAGLLLSPLPFVADLGIAVPIGLALVIGISLLVSWARPQHSPKSDAVPAGTTKAAGGPSVPKAALAAATVVAVAGAALGWAALSSVSLRTDPQQLLAGLPALDRAVHVEEVLGHSGEIDVRLEGDDVLTAEALRWSREAERRIVTQYGDRVHPVVTVAGMLEFLGNDPTGAQVRAGMNALPPYVTAAVVSPDQTQALTSYGVAWSDLARDRDLVANLQEALPPPPEGYSVKVSGLPVAAEQGYRLVSGERYEASLLALLASAVALLLLLPRRGDALLAVLVAVVASGLTVSVLVLAVGALNPLTLALGALTAAVGSEFTVLLLAAARSKDAALQRSVLLAALLSLGGYGVLLTSSLPVLRELGLALTTSVALSVLVAWLTTTLRASIRSGAEPRRRARKAPVAKAATVADPEPLQLTGGAP